MSWSQLTRDQKLVTGFTIFTGLSHILFSYGWKREILGINLFFWFVLNGLGFLGILYILYFSNQSIDNQNRVRYLLGAWTIGSIIAWAMYHTSGDGYTTLVDPSLINKTVEVLILIFLYFDMTKSQSNT